MSSIQCHERLIFFLKSSIMMELSEREISIINYQLSWQANENVSKWGGK